MAVSEQTIQKFAGLKPFLPKGSFKKILYYFEKYSVFLKITKERRSKNGDYRAPSRKYPMHRISVNSNLNPYNFLITLLHEIAHMMTFIKFGSRVTAHGREWQSNFRIVFSDFRNQGIFPAELESKIAQHLNNVKATTCSDSELQRTLKAYDVRQPDVKFVEEIPLNGQFKIKDGRTYRVIKKLRTRYYCLELETNRFFYVPALLEVKEIREKNKVDS